LVSQAAPYTIALVKLEEGPVVTAQLTDIGDQKVEIGMPVEMVTWKLRTDMEDREMIVYGLPKWLPMVVRSTLFVRAKHSLRS